MRVEIVTTGTELLLGEIVNTNAAYLADRLNQLGFDVLYQSTVGDNRGRMGEVLTHALSRADIVITSGGLGPTQGDITKEVTARALGLKMRMHEASLARLEAYFASRRRPMTENNRRQAMLAEGAAPIPNEQGTAPGMITEKNGKTIINLPGPPHELKWMFEHHLKPFLERRYGFHGVIASRLLHTTGIGESTLEEKIQDLILAQSNPTLALLARSGEVLIRITAKADTQEEARAKIGGLEREIRRRAGTFIFAVDDENMESVVGRLLQQGGFTVALAESCTGGLTASRLTDVPGSSAYVAGGVVTYNNEAKIARLGVKAASLASYGAVSEPTAVQMAEGVKKVFGADFGVGITGIAGPGGATADKAVGLVYTAVCGPDGVQCVCNHFRGSRKSVKYQASQAALELLRNRVLASVSHNGAPA